MKFIHISDLHLGKRFNEQSLIEDQKYILGKIIEVVDNEKPNGVLIAGDVYDKSVPSAEAVMLFDDFLNSLAKRSVQVFIISGNHDSAERMSFGSNLMEQSGVHIARVYNGVIPKYTLTDEYGEVCVHLLPFIKPSNVKPFFDNEIKTYTDAIRVALSNAEIDKDKRNILVTHQFVTGASRSESEEISVGGTDNVDASVFEDFDYVALGHIHGPQNCGSEKIRYCGTPLKYSFSEAKDEKSVTVVELNEKNSLIIRTIPLTPLHDMVEIKGKFEDIMSKSFYENTTYENDYVRVTLTDEDDILDAIGKLRTVYHNILRLDYDNLRTKAITEIDTADVDNKSPYELFSELFAMQNGQEMSQEQADLVKSLIEKIWEDK